MMKMKLSGRHYGILKSALDLVVEEQADVVMGFKTFADGDDYEDTEEYKDTTQFLAELREVRDHLTASLVQHAWAELCAIIQPGSVEGMRAMCAAINEGPPKAPDEEAFREMEAAIMDEYPYPTDNQTAIPINAYDAVIEGRAFAGLEPNAMARLNRLYPQFIQWCTEVFPG